MRSCNSLKFALTSASVALFFAVAVSTAGATVTVLETFKTEVDVNISIQERSIWDGIYPGCYAPQEKFDQTYKLKFDSRPSSRSKIKAGTTTLYPSGYGTTASYGAKSSLRQSAKSGPWELQIKNPAGCSSAGAPVPAWATSPTCKQIEDRVMATIVGASGTAEGGKVTDGSITLFRVAKASAASRGRSIGASCWRTLHNVGLGGIDQAFEIGLKDTAVQIPVPGLRQKLSKLADGSARSRPSFKVPFKISGDCNAAKMSPSVGIKDGYTPLVGTLPHEALGHIFEQTNRSACMVSGSGSVTVRRVGATKSTSVPDGLRRPNALAAFAPTQFGEEFTVPD